MPSISCKLQLEKYRFSPLGIPHPRSTSKTKAATFLKELGALSTQTAENDCIDCTQDYPSDETERRTFKTKKGKVITAHQWAVYDLVRKIPIGKVTTYKEICSALGSGSPRSVGTALRNNPFAPVVPCHRVIASTGYVGGFFGEWNNPSKNHGQGNLVRRKIEMLDKEGVHFTDKGYLIGGDKIIWRAAD